MNSFNESPGMYSAEIVNTKYNVIYSMNHQNEIVMQSDFGSNITPHLAFYYNSWVLNDSKTIQKSESKTNTLIGNQTCDQIKVFLRFKVIYEPHHELLDWI